MKVVLTCEHAGNAIPEQYREIFRDAGDILNSHRGYDPGALDLLTFLRDLSDVSFYHSFSRLLVEVNRSCGHPQLFSEFTAPLSSKEQKNLVESYYTPYRQGVETAVGNLIAKGHKVLHLSIHSFTPVLDGKIRNTDLGLLYDPTRPEEKNLSKKFQEQLQLESPTLKARFNYPYLGKADGFTTYLRKRFPGNYLGIELEVNQKFAKDNAIEEFLKQTIFQTLDNLLKYLRE